MTRALVIYFRKNNTFLVYISNGVVINKRKRLERQIRERQLQQSIGEGVLKIKRVTERGLISRRVRVTNPAGRSNESPTYLSLGPLNKRINFFVKCLI